MSNTFTTSIDAAPFGMFNGVRVDTLFSDVTLRDSKSAKPADRAAASFAGERRNVFAATEFSDVAAFGGTGR